MSARLRATRPLGRSGIAIPPIALGCGNFGGIGSAPEFFGRGLTPDQALELMDAAWGLGITHFDTADAYGGGRSERAIGPSLDRLGVEQVDLYLAHDFDPGVPIGETTGAFEAAVAGGTIRGYGVSNFDAAQLAAALAAGSPLAIQNGYSLLDRRDERDVLPLCARQPIAYLAFSPLAGGWLTGKYRRGDPFPAGSRMTQRPGPYLEFMADRTFAALGRLEAMAACRGTSMAGLALGWLLAGDRVTQVVIGPGRPEHLAPVREALEHPVTDSERAEMEGIFA